MKPGELTVVGASGSRLYVNVDDKDPAYHGRVYPDELCLILASRYGYAMLLSPRMEIGWAHSSYLRPGP